MGFEPTTSSVTGWHSNHLNYGAILKLHQGFEPLNAYYYAIMRARSTTVGEHHEAYNVGFSTIGIPTTDPPLPCDI